METTFQTEAEQMAECAEQLGAFSGVKLLHIRKQVEDVLALIGRGGIFDQYTKHDISHVDQMLDIIAWIIPKETKGAMTPADWLMLVLASYFHDMGMLVTKKEFENRAHNAGFVQYKHDIYNAPEEEELQLSEEEERFLYQEYVRKTHAKRINRWINGTFEEIERSTVDQISKILEPFPPAFKRDLGKICESHHLDDLNDFSKYSTLERYGNSDGECANLHYTAIILRTADLLHITKDRTPSIQFSLINPSDSKSIIEWQKQQAVSAVAAQDPRDKEGHIDRTLAKDTIEVIAYFDKPDQAEAFFGLSSYIRLMRDEIRKCYGWVQESIRKEGTEKYLYPWQNVDDEKIETCGFEPRKLSFTIDQNSILQMLVGHTLYNNSSVVIRELIQNGIDAVKLQYCIEHRGEDIPQCINAAKVSVSWDKDERSLTVSDNGTGMTIDDVENYLLKVGVSKYRSKEFQQSYPKFPAISRFGIGILTCFLIADDVDITTSSAGEENANIISLRNVNGKYLVKKVPKKELPDLIKHHGTSIKLHVRSGVDIDSILADAKKWILFPPCEVCLDHGESPVSIGYPSPKDALIQYLADHRCVVDGKNYQVQEETKDGVTLAYALKYNAYFHEWEFVTSYWLRIDEEEDFSPVGTCIEGIRVEFSPPGYKESAILAVANTKNSSLVLTNVARSAIEENDSTDRYTAILYELYAKHVRTQINKLQELGYSLSWATSEASVLLKPLQSGYRSFNSRTRPNNNALLQEQLAQIECIVVEQDNARRAASASQILEFDKVLIVDSEMVLYAESLLRQTRSETTLISILKTVQNDIAIQPNIPLFCNYQGTNALHQYALQNKEAEIIIVDKDQRRIDIVFSAATGRWDVIETLDSADRFRGRAKIVHVPTSDVKIEGISDEVGVETVDGVYLSRKNPLIQYVCNQMSKFRYKESGDDMMLARMFMTIVTNGRVLNAVQEEQSSVNLDRILIKILESPASVEPLSELLTKLWGIIDKDELLGTMLAQKYTIYRPRDWSRGAERGDNY